MSVEGSGTRNDFMSEHQVVLPQSFGTPQPQLAQASVSGFTYIQPPPSQPYISDSKYHFPSVPGVLCQQAEAIPNHFNSVYATRNRSAPVITDGHSPHHPSGINTLGSPHPFQQPATNYYMNHSLTNQPTQHPPNHLPIKQEPGQISFDNQYGSPFYNGEAGSVPGHISFIKQEPGTSVSYNQHEMGTGVSFIKQEPGTDVPFIKQEPGTTVSASQPCGNIPFIKQEPKHTLPSSNSFPVNQSLPHYNHSLSTQDASSNAQFGVSFPSRPLNLNFMADIEDIVQPSLSEVSIESIKNELSCFDGPTDVHSHHQRVKEELEEESWEPPLWRQQYENIRSMRAKRDAPVDKYGCFMNAEKEVAPEVRRYQLLVSLMMSSQTKDEVVGKAMTKLKAIGLTIDNILDTPQEEIARLIFPVGFWNKKAEYIKKTTHILKDKFASDIPDSVEGLVSLPGIGPKMAHLIMDFAWGQVSGIAVDTHVHRITHRLGWMRKEARNPEEARKSLERWFPKEEWSDLNLLCVGFGQQICSPVGPKCSECLNKDLCPSSSCLVSTGLPLGIGFEVSTKSKKKAKSSPTTPKGKVKKIKIED